MSYDNILTTLGLTQMMAESFLVYSLIAIGVGFILFTFWHYIALGVFVFGIFTVLSHSTQNTTTVVKNSQPIITEEYSVEKDPNMQKTSLVDPILLMLKLKEMAQLANVVEPQKEVKVDVVQVVETEEMREYVKNCTELTNNSALCRENWNAMAETGGEIILDPVERRVRKQITKAKVEKASTKSHSKVTEVKLLDVDNTEYKERRATALSKPNAVVFQETYR